METSASLSTVDYRPFVELLFYLFLLGYLIFSTVLVFHWRSYATDARVATVTLVGYFGTTLTLLALGGLALMAI